jgi:DNA invertase Pin-like site-specific DNA recombinase
MRPEAKRVRCAIYTRKSSEEGLDQAFNSLDAQREACEAYVRSQAGEGWVASPSLYDDGGFSGGNLERPALKRLLTDIDAGWVDIVVVYKIDRLTRSLADFARIVERFDKVGASFVSVTQAFNTTTSMGRLTLNVLLSFAQFEREVTGERIRDKIAASKAKGMWMGGNLPLGYDAPTDPATRALVVNQAEAETVRSIFQRYIALQSVYALQRELEAGGVRSKMQVAKNGRSRGGVILGRGALFHLLSNRVYLGEIPHVDRSYPGSHPGIVDPEVFAEAQALLGSKGSTRGPGPVRNGASLLTGKLFDATGAPMSPTSSRSKSGQLYRYYVSTGLQTGGKPAAIGGPQRLSAPEIERLVQQQVADLFPTEAGTTLAKLRKVIVRDATVEFIVQADPDADRGRLHDVRSRLGAHGDAWLEGDGMHVLLAVKVRTRGGRSWIEAGDQKAAREYDPDPVLIRQLRMAHAGLKAAGIDPDGWMETLRSAQSPTDVYVRKIAPLAFLAPDLQAAILSGRLQFGRSLEEILAAGLPLAWADQRRLAGIG